MCVVVVLVVVTVMLVLVSVHVRERGVLKAAELLLALVLVLATTEVHTSITPHSNTSRTGSSRTWQARNKLTSRLLGVWGCAGV